jgi:hypothetical protein
MYGYIEGREISGKALGRRASTVAQGGLSTARPNGAESGGLRILVSRSAAANRIKQDLGNR